MMKRKLILGLGGLAIAFVLVGGAVWFFWPQISTQISLKMDAFKYRGLVTSIDVQFKPGEREIVEGRLQEATQKLVDEKNAGGEITDTLYLDIADSASILGDLITAREAYEVYLQKYPHELAPLLNYAHLLIDMHDYARSEAQYRLAIAEWSTYEAGYRGLIEAIASGAPDGSRDNDIRAELEAAVNAVGQTPWLMVQLAGWYESHGDCQRAIDHLSVVAQSAESESARNSAKDDIEDIRKTCH